MLRLKAFRPTSDKIVKIQLHPTHPWMVTADDSDRVSVWNWEHRQVQKPCSIHRVSFWFVVYALCFLLCFNGNLIQVVYELKAGGVDERRLVGAKLEKLAEGEIGSILFNILSMNELLSCSIT